MTAVAAMTFNALVLVEEDIWMETLVMRNSIDRLGSVHSGMEL